ncbi:unnamed protein product [Cuscuta epithymum]|uniref:Uncharacterized protein n=1 Tax=Cuscuta epithymum TaxID=186058 RepID=A0AAV0CJZ8_9ASTE|nr:unnamed protein product [Cuscuta epithymum]
MVTATSNIQIVDFQQRHLNIYSKLENFCLSQTDSRSTNTMESGTYGLSAPTKVSILSPQVSKNKDPGHRIKGAKEVSIDKRNEQKDCRN